MAESPALRLSRRGRGTPPTGQSLRPKTRPMAPYVLLAPTVAFLSVFIIWPTIRALLLAVQGQSGQFSAGTFNAMLADYQFWPAVRNTLLLIVAIIPLQFILALVMALVVQSGIRGSQFFLYVWTVPLAISDLAAGILWLSIFTDHGYLNSLLVDLGLSKSGYQFLSYQHPLSLFLVVVVAEIWRSTSLVMLILLGGLQSIPKEYGEAADIFGASGWQRVRHVTVPLLRPSIQVALILRTIFAFQAFAVIIALTGQQLPILAGQAYFWFYSYQNPNIAAAYSVVILVLSIGASIIYLSMVRPRAQAAAGNR